MNAREKYPETAAWTRFEFLRARQLQFEHAKANPPRIPGFEDVATIVMEPPDCEIVCDLCNDLIEGEKIVLVHHGRQVHCEKCLKKYKRWKEEFADDQRPEGP